MTIEWQRLRSCCNIRRAATCLFRAWSIRTKLSVRCISRILPFIVIIFSGHQQTSSSLRGGRVATGIILWFVTVVAFYSKNGVIIPSTGVSSLLPPFKCRYLDMTNFYCQKPGNMSRRSWFFITTHRHYLKALKRWNLQHIPVSKLLNEPVYSTLMGTDVLYRYYTARFFYPFQRFSLVPYHFDSQFLFIDGSRCPLSRSKTYWAGCAKSLKSSLSLLAP